MSICNVMRCQMDNKKFIDVTHYHLNYCFYIRIRKFKASFALPLAENNFIYRKIVRLLEGK